MMNTGSGSEKLPFKADLHQPSVVAIALERDPQQWKLGWNIRLFTVVYCVSC